MTVYGRVTAVSEVHRYSSSLSKQLAVIFISHYCLISCRNGPDNYLLLLQVSDIQNYHTCCIVVQVRALDF